MMVSEVDARPIDSTVGRWLSIVGIGEDGVDGLNPLARSLIETAELVVGGRRHLDLASSLVRGETLAWPSPIENAYPQILNRRGRAVAVLASGDPFHFGIGKQLAAIVPTDEFVCIPKASAFSLAAARLGWALQDVCTLSLHGRALEGIVRYLQPGARILALSWDATTPSKLAALLTERGCGRSRLCVLERLGGANARVRSSSAQAFALETIDPLNTIALEVVCDRDAKVIPLSAGLDDTYYENDGQLTKREIRALVLSSLAPRSDELLWDVGLGAGSVAIEWLLRHPSLRAIGVEQDGARAGRAARNAAALGAMDLEIVEGHAPDAFADLPQPDAVFIGGGLGSGVLDAAHAALRPGGRLVANAVTLEGEQVLAAAYQRYGGELLRLQVSRADHVGRLHGWRPAMPVTHWRMTKT